jgi:hypothetical protein
MQLGFNTEAYDFYKGPELLQAGNYPVVIEDVVAERAKDPASGLLKITFVVAQGHANAGRKLFYRLNLWNVSEESKATAHKQLKNLCYAVGIQGQLADTDQLKQRTCVVEVNNDGTYNNIKKVMDAAGNVPGGAPLQAGAPGQAGFPAAPAGFTPGAPAGAVAGGFTPGAPTGFAAPAGAPGPVPGAPGPVPVAAPFPPAGWAAHPTSPGWFYELANPANFKQEPELRALPAAPAPVAAAPGNPFAAPGGGNPFQQPTAGVATSPAAGFQPAGGQAQAPAGWPGQ